PGSRHAARLLSRALPDSLERQNRLRRARRFFTVASRPMVERYAHWVTFFDEPAKASLYRPEMRARLNGARPIGWLKSLFARFADLDPGEAAMAADVLSYPPYDQLVNVVITSIANTLVGR